MRTKSLKMFSTDFDNSFVNLYCHCVIGNVYILSLLLRGLIFHFYMLVEQMYSTGVEINALKLCFEEVR